PEVRARARPAGAALGGNRDQPACARPPSRRVLRRRADPPVALQATGERRTRRTDRRAARGDHRPLRADARAGTDAFRRASTSPAGAPLRGDEDRRRRQGDGDHLRSRSADRRPAHHRAGAEEPPHQARRQRAVAHRARSAAGEGSRPAGSRRAARARHAEAPRGGMSGAARATPGLVVRGVVTPLRLADFGLIAFDMDSTLITIECVDEIAKVAGKGAEVAAITEAAMRGEIADYKESLRRRVALLEGVPEAALQRVYDERLRLNPGAEALVAACRDAGLKTLLVSGGFTFFSDRVRDRLGIDFTRSNVLEIEAGALTGRMVVQPWGDICDGAEKRR